MSTIWLVKERLPVADGEKELLVVVTGVGGGLDVDEAELAGIGALVQVGHGHGVGVVPARAEGRGGEAVAALAVGRNDGRAFFVDAVDFGGDGEAVPVDELGGVGVVDDVDGDGLAFLHAQDRAGRGAVVADGGEDAVLGEFDGDGRDAKGDVGRSGRCGGRRVGWAGKHL